MPPKPSQQKPSKQTKLFSKEILEHQPKSKSRQFDHRNGIPATTAPHKWQYGDGTTPNQLLISSWNVNGIRALIAKHHLNKYLQKANPDIICINETKIDAQAFNKASIQLAGYYGYWNFCKCSGGYSGVAILSKYKPISSTEDLQEKQHSQQGRVITLEFQQFYLVAAYVPNAGSNLDRLDYRVKEYDQAFHKHCQALRNNKNVIICGDLNVCHQQIDIARPKANERTAGFTLEERNSFSQFLSKGWIDSFRKLYPQEVKYSWWSMRTAGRANNIGWRLDYFLVNEEAWQWVEDSTINNDVMGSDHCPIELRLRII